MNNTTTYSDYTQSLFTQIALAFGNYWICIVCPIGISFNMIILVTLIRSKGVVPPTTRVLMTNQSIVEMSACMWLIIGQISKSKITSYSYNDLGHAVCFILPFTFWIFDALAGFGNALITIERYFAVCHPLKRVFTVKGTRMFVVCLDVVIASVATFELWMTLKIAPDGECVWNTDGPWLKLSTGVFFTEEMVSLLSVIMFYPQMLHTIKQSSAKLHQSGGGNVKAAASNRLTATLFAASVVQIISNTSNTILYSITLSFMGIQLVYPWSVQQVFETVPKTLYPTLNPVLYAFSSPKFRLGIVRAFTCKNYNND